MSNKDLETRIIAQLKTRLRKRDLTLSTYAVRLRTFCEACQIDPFDFPKIGLKAIENLTEQFINDHIQTVAPKALNVTYCAVKAWCFATGVIENRKLFREIDFDKSSRKTDAITEQPLEPAIVKKLFEVCDVDEKILLGLYGLNGLRPALMPKAVIGWIFPQHYKIEQNTFKFTVKNPFMYIPKNIEGNKASGITFFTILHSKIAEFIEYGVNLHNEAGTIDRNTPLLSKYQTRKDIWKKVHKLFSEVGFDGRPYLLRSFADYVYDSAGLKRESGMPDEDFKEQLMQHKGVISAVYQGKGLPQTVIDMYTQMFQSVEKWINENVFGVVSQTQISAAQQLGLFARNLGVNENQIEIMLKALENGSMKYDIFQQRLKELTDEAFNLKMRQNIEATIMSVMQQKGLIAPAPATQTQPALTAPAP